LSRQLDAVEAENPRLQVRLSTLLREEAELQNRLRENQFRIATRMRENEILRVQQDNFVLQARAIGKITQYIETSETGQTSSTLQVSVETARMRVAVLEQELDAETTRERLSAFLNIIGHYMTTYSEALELEHRGSQLRLDIRNLTVVADTLDGPVPHWSQDIDQVVMQGNAITKEVVFFHRKSATVIFTDIIQQLPTGWFSGWRAVMAKWDLMLGPEPSVPRKFRAAFTNRRAARASLEHVLAWPAEKVLMAHGTPVTEGGQAFIRQAFRWLIA
jgi:hypothetical protein